MPYFVTDKADGCSGWATIKADGEVIGCHKTKVEAVAQMVAVSLSEKMQPGGERKDSGPQAVIVDIDGTLIQSGRRVEKVYNFLDDMSDTKIFIVTGRNVSDRDSTAKQLNDLGIDYDRLFMNPGSTADTADFKSATAEKLLKEYNVILAIDNNPTMRKVYRDLGITALDVPDVPKVLSDENDPDEERIANISVPTYMRAAARRGLELNRQGFGGDGLTDKTLAEARAMADGRVSEDKWRRIGPWIARHLVDLDAPKNNNPDDSEYPGAGLVAHLLWGSGPTKARAVAAANYAENVVEKLDENRHLPGGHDQLTHGAGGGSGGERKYVQGRNLIGNELKADNALDNSLNNKKGKFNDEDWKNDKYSEDEALHEIADIQGFSGKPTIANSKKEYDELKKPTYEQLQSDFTPEGVKNRWETREVDELYRGTRDSESITAQKAMNEFENGNYYAGKGTMGNGIYSSTNKAQAKLYANGDSKNVMNFKLNPNAKVGNSTKLLVEMREKKDTLPRSVLDLGRYAAANGYDAVVDDSFFGGDRKKQVIILNRTAVVLPPRG